MDSSREVFDELFEPVDFEGGAHDDKHVRFACNVCGLDGADVVSQGVRLVVEDNGRAEGADFEGTSRAGYTSLSW